MRDVLNFEIACLQTRARQVSVSDAKQRDLDIRANIERICQLIDYVTSFGSSEVKLIVTPEYAINGHWSRKDVDQWIKICTTVPGPYTEVLANKAIERKVYIAANMLE